MKNEERYNTEMLSKFIFEIYDIVLFRRPTLLEIEPHLKFVQDGGSIYELLVSIARGDEATNLRGLFGYRTRFGIRDFISLLYESKLGRLPSEEEFNFWKRPVENRDEFISLYNEITNSQEAQDFVKTKQILKLERDPQSISNDNQISNAIINLYEGVLKRTPNSNEVDAWLQISKNGMPLSDIISSLVNSEEAINNRNENSIFRDESDGIFFQKTYEIILGRGITSHEISILEHQMRGGFITREKIIKNCFLTKYSETLASLPTNDATQTNVLGSTKFFSKNDWEERKTNLGFRLNKNSYNNFPIKTRQNPKVSIITSMYNGLEYMECFLNNMISQTIFEQCELIIIDANSPQNEYAKFKKIIDKYPNIKYNKSSSRIGIYDAWNLGVNLSTAPYITNANLDDLRRTDSLQIQSAVLDTLDFVDVVYQDFYYSFEPNIDFEKVESIGIKSDLPVISNNNLMSFNSPHNAPMWRRSIHLDVGMFDTSYKSAGDYDFWLRCIHLGKTFYKLNDPHVVYYVNPKGLSTNSDTVGVLEARSISKIMNKKLTSNFQIMHLDQLSKEIEKICGASILFNSEIMSRYDFLQKAILNLR